MVPLFDVFQTPPEAVATKYSFKFLGLSNSYSIVFSLTNSETGITILESLFAKPSS